MECILLRKIVRDPNSLGYLTFIASTSRRKITTLNHSPGFEPGILHSAGSSSPFQRLSSTIWPRRSGNVLGKDSHGCPAIMWVKHGKTIIKPSPQSSPEIGGNVYHSKWVVYYWFYTHDISLTELIWTEWYGMCNASSEIATLLGLVWPGIV